MSFTNYIDNAEVILIGHSDDEENPVWAEFCITEEGSFFFAEYTCDCKRSDAKIFFVSEEEARYFLHENACPNIYNYCFNS